MTMAASPARPESLSSGQERPSAQMLVTTISGKGIATEGGSFAA
jgi:hypothetical protein